MFNYKFDSKEDYYIDNPTVNSTWKGLIKYYDFYNPKFIVAGDGASWIRTLAKYLGAYYVFDKYHALNYLLKVYKPNIGTSRKIILNKEKYNNYKIAKDYFCNGQYNQLIEFLIKSQTKGAKTYNYKTLNNMLIAKTNYLNNRI